MGQIQKLTGIDQEALELFYKDLEERPIAITTIKVIKELIKKQKLFSEETVGNLRIQLHVEIECSADVTKEDFKTAKNYIFSLQGNNIITTCTTIKTLFEIIRDNIRELSPQRKRSY